MPFDTDKKIIDLRIRKTIPPKFRDLETDKEIKPCMDKNLFIYRGSGTGKTVFVCTVAKEYIKKGERVRFYSYPKLLMELQNLYFKGNTELTAVDLAKDIADFNGVIILDDLGSEKITDFTRQLTYYIINEREQWLMPLIMTSNFSLDEIDKKIDSRISSSIAGMCEIIKLKGKDRRLKSQ